MGQKLGGGTKFLNHVVNSLLELPINWVLIPIDKEFSRESKSM